MDSESKLFETTEMESRLRDLINEKFQPENQVGCEGEGTKKKRAKKVQKTSKKGSKIVIFTQKGFNCLE